MQYTVSKQFEFSAAHSLPTLPIGHPCRRQHGHNYRVEVAVQASGLDDHGMVVDFGEIDVISDEVRRLFDHRDLNMAMTGPTTAENVAAEIMGMAERHIEAIAELYPFLIEVKYVQVWETPKAYAMVCRE